MAVEDKGQTTQSMAESKGKAEQWGGAPRNKTWTVVPQGASSGDSLE